MDDARLAATVDLITDVERELRAAFDGAGEDLAERDSAQAAVRLIVPVRKALEGWIVRRTLRAQLGRTQLIGETHGR